jgi:hypothetical protein
MASISDDAVLAKTGKSWREWFRVLDKAGAKKMTHRDIARWLGATHSLSGWWSQTVTVEYERARGMREMYEKSDGFAASVSRTMPVEVGALYEAWADARKRKGWLGGAAVRVTKAGEGKVLRMAADGGSRVTVSFYPKGESKTQVVVQHEKLAGAAAVAESKARWRDALSRLEVSLR